MFHEPKNDESHYEMFKELMSNSTFFLIVNMSIQSVTAVFTD